MLHVSLVLLVAIQGTRCAGKTRWVAVRDSLCYALCLAESPQPETMLYRSTPTRGEVHDTLPVRSLTTMKYPHVAVDGGIVCPRETTRTMLELGE